ncbi:MAG: retroviral-like aspartic protease family protein, partial [Pirellulales bacterium]|nr:retroviral-like aspartic protease family protein [Pirellulales bacterium]
MRRLAWVFAAAAVCAAVVFAVGLWLARPGGLQVGEAPTADPQIKLERDDFWTAIRDFDLESAARADRPHERRRFAAALEMVAEGDRAEAVRDFQTLHEQAQEARIRQEAAEALKRLLRAMARWDELARLDPEGIEGEFYRQSPPQEVHFPAEPVRIATRTGWLRVPRLRVELNGRSYTFAVDTGADPTVITDEVAEECGIEVSKRAALTATSTSRQVEWRAAVARD